MQTFAGALNDLLAGNGMSGKELARRAEVDAAQVGRWRRGRGLPRPENLIRVATVLGVDYEWLFGIAYPEAHSSTPAPDLIETAIRSRSEEIREALRDVPRPFWLPIIKSTFDQAIDNARAMAVFWAEVNHQPPVSASDLPEVSTPDRQLKGDNDAHGTELARRQQAGKLLAILAA